MGGMMDDVVTGNATGLENKIADVNSDVSNALDVIATHYEKEVGDVAEAAADVVSTVGSVMAETAGDVVNTLGDAVSNFFSSETEADEPTYNP